MSDEHYPHTTNHPSPIPPSTPETAHTDRRAHTNDAAVHTVHSPTQVPTDNVEPQDVAPRTGLDKTTLTALITFWLAYICLIAALIVTYFFASRDTEVLHFVLTISFWVLWVIGAISSASALLFARVREKLAAFLLLTIVAVDLAFLLIPMDSGYHLVFQILHLFINIDLLVAATYIATRKSRTTAK